MYSIGYAGPGDKKRGGGGAPCRDRPAPLSQSVSFNSGITSRCISFFLIFLPGMLHQKQDDWIDFQTSGDHSDGQDELRK